MQIRIRHTPACGAMALVLFAATAAAQPAPAVAPAPPAAAPVPTARVADDDDFKDAEDRLESPLDAKSPMRFACTRAEVYSRQAANIELCWAQPRGVAPLVTAATALAHQVCRTEPLPLDVEWARQRQEVEQTNYDAALAKQAGAGPAEVEAEAQKVAAAKRALEAAEAEAQRAKELDAVRVAMTGAFDAVVDSATPQDFVEVLENDGRKQACRELGEAIRSVASASTELNQRVEAARVEAIREPSRAHDADRLRKSSVSLTAVTAASGEVEHAGSPDTVALAVMSALGADKQTAGSNVVMTLNLATLVVQKQEQRLELSAPVRNLFLRVTAPLESTESGPATSAPDETAAADTEPEVKRLNLVLGTSLLDSSDPRLAPNRDCYQRVLDYYPPASTVTKEAERTEKRKQLFDVCNRRAAYQHRLALRAGISLVTDQNGDAPDTRPELYAGALVYAPAPWFYTNVLYQAIVEPTELHVFGAGFSLGTNVGGRDSGVDSWSRVGLDTLFLVARSSDTEDWDWEWRIVPTARVKLGDAVAQLGIGPRILGSGDGGVFASIALAYDVDALMDPMLTSPAAPGAAP